MATQQLPTDNADNVYFFFSVPNLSGCSVNHHYDTFPHVQWWPKLIKLGQKIGAPPQKTLVAPNFKIQLQIQTSSERNKECMKNATRYRQTENCVTNCNISHTCLRNLVNSGWQIEKNGLEFLTYQMTAIGFCHLANLGCIGLSLILGWLCSSWRHAVKMLSWFIKHK